MSEPNTYRWGCPSCGESYNTKTERDDCYTAHEAAERLRDAAPDLYSAIKAVLARRDASPTDELGHEADDVMALLEAAVAKADGR